MLLSRHDAVDRPVLRPTVQVLSGCSTPSSVSNGEPVPRLVQQLIRKAVVFAGGILIGIAAFKRNMADQRAAAERFMGGRSETLTAKGGKPLITGGEQERPTVRMRRVGWTDAAHHPMSICVARCVLMRGSS